MHVFRVVLLVAVVLVGTSDAFLVKQVFLKNILGVKANYIEDTKASLAKFKDGVVLSAHSVLDSVKALAKAKIGVLASVHKAKVGVGATIAAAKLAKLGALSGASLAYLKGLAGVGLLAKGIVAKKALGLGAAAALKKGAVKSKVGGKILEGFGGQGGILPALGGIAGGLQSGIGGAIVEGLTGGKKGGFGGGFGGDNPIGSVIGGLVSGALSKAQNGGGPLAALVGGHGGFGGPAAGPFAVPVVDVSSHIPIPPKPTINIQTYQLHPQPAVQPSTIIYSEPAPSFYLDPPTPIHTYGPPATSYGPPRSRK